MRKSDFQFTDPYLASLQFEVNDDFNVENDNQIEMGAKIDVSHKLLNDSEAIVELSITIGGKELKDPFYLKSVVTANFRWVEDLAKDQIDSFLKINAPALLLSYSRPIIAMTTNSSCYPAYNIPFINFDN